MFQVSRFWSTFDHCHRLGFFAWYNLDARSDLLDYYLQAPPLVGGDAAKARTQAQEITKRNAEEGKKAWQKCEQTDALIPVEAAPPQEAAPPLQYEPAGAGQ